MSAVRVTFVGLGAMGEPMAGNLLKRGFAVTVVGHRRPDPVERLRGLGAAVADTPGAAAADCDVAVLMLPTSDEVERVVTSPDGLIGAMRRGRAIVDCSTSDPDRSRALAGRLREQGLRYVDAPVTRGVQGARDGKLAFFVGGERSDVASVRPVLEAMGDTFLAMGPAGAGHATKILVQALSYATVALVNEALMLGASAGLDAHELQRALTAGAGSKALESFGPRIVDRQYAPARVRVGDACKHMALARRMAEARGCSHAVHDAAERIVQSIAERGMSASDLSALAELWPAAPAGRP